MRIPVNYYNVLDSKSRWILEKLLLEKILGVDCEGKLLGRFGNIEWITISSKRNISIFDMKQCIDLLPYLKEILESDAIVKIFHDCREDASTLFNVHGIKLNSIYDTSIAHNMFTEKQNRFEGTFIHQGSINALVKKYLGRGVLKEATIPKEFINSDECTTYAANGVLHLHNLFSHFCDILMDVDGSAIISRSIAHSEEYPNTNLELSPSSNSLKTGKRIDGILASKQGSVAYWKLNLGRILGVSKNLLDLRCINIGERMLLQICKDFDETNEKILNVRIYSLVKDSSSNETQQEKRVNKKY